MSWRKRVVRPGSRQRAAELFEVCDGRLESLLPCAVALDVEKHWSDAFAAAVRRAHPDDPDPTWYGHSVGHYEGDTLVVDTIGFNDKFWFDFRGHPHSEKLHTVERYTRKDMGSIVVQTTITDPVYYTKPFTITFTGRLRPGEELMEYICQENEQDAVHIKGPAGTP